MGKMILNGLAHAIIALVMQGIVGILTGNWWAGAALGIGFYWGREKRDHEIKVQHIPALAVWWKGWTPFEWCADGQNDFWWPFVVTIATALVMGFAPWR